MDRAVIDRIRGYAEDGMSPERIASTLGVPLADVRRHTVGVSAMGAPAANQHRSNIGAEKPAEHVARPSGANGSTPAAEAAARTRAEYIGHAIMVEGRKQVDLARELGIPQQHVQDGLVLWHKARELPVPKPLPGLLTQAEVTERRRAKRAARAGGQDALQVLEPAPVGTAEPTTTAVDAGASLADQGAGSARPMPDAPADVAAEPVATTDGSAAAAVPGTRLSVELLDAEIAWAKAELADHDRAVAALEARRAALRVLIANLEPTRDAYAELAAAGSDRA